MAETMSEAGFDQEVQLMADANIAAIANAVKSLDAIGRIFVGRLIESSAEKKNYTDKLESATGEDIFKYLLLINVSALDSYVAQTRIQAQESFRWCKMIAVLGFILIASGIVFSIYSTYRGVIMLTPAYLASIAGILTEFTSGVFFYLYNRTIQQVNIFHDKILSSQQVSMAFMANSIIPDENKRTETQIDLAKSLVMKATQQL
jgi:hypothetical protein